jgi:hypothetical protein
MSLIDIFNKNQSSFTPINLMTYEQFVFNMEKNGVNDLVARDKVDPTFRPPLVSNSYLASLFKQKAI